MTTKKVHKRLKSSLETGAIVCARRSHDKNPVYGFVVGQSKDWVLLHKIYDCHFDGWVTLRLTDFTSVERSTGFVSQLLEKRGLAPQAQPTLDLTEIASILQTAHSVAPLVCIELEKRWPGTCYIGRVEKVGKRKVRLAEIDSEALWNRNDSFPLKDITQISLGNDYCEGLWEMGQENAPFSL